METDFCLLKALIIAGEKLRSSTKNQNQIDNIEEENLKKFKLSLMFREM